MKFNLPQNIIPRIRYINAVTPFMEKNIIKVFTGQRRVGKSYLLYQLIQQITRDKKASIIYINKEDLNFSAIKKSRGFKRLYCKKQEK